MILVKSPTGNVLVDERTGSVLDEQALRSLARQVALTSGQNPDAFEASMAELTGFDPLKMTTANGLDPQGFFVAAANQGDPGLPEPPGPPVAPPPGGPGLIPGGFTTPEQRTADLALLQAQIAKLTDPTAKAIAEAQLQQILAQTANIGAGTGASAAVSRQNALDSVAEQQRQFNETFGFQKAQFDQRAIGDAADRTQKADQFAAGQALSREQLDVQRGNALLGLGQRPDTLIKYLYALQGQQTPQAIGGTTTNLPGYRNVVGQPTPQSTTPLPFPAAGAAGLPSPQPAPTVAPRASLNLPNVGAPNPLTMGTPQQNAYAQQNATNQQAAGGVVPADPFASLRPGGIAAPQLSSAAITPQSALAQQNQAPGTLSLSGGQMAPGQTYAAPINLPPQTGTSGNIVTGFTNYGGDRGIEQSGREEVQRPDYLGGGTFWRDYAQGGVIPEPVTGVGDVSGQPYKFGEEGPEAVMSNEMLQKLMAVASKVDFHSKGSDGKSQRITMTLGGPPKLGAKKKADMPTDDHDQMPMNSYASGGAIGYDPSRVPTLGSQSAGLFNDPNLANVVGRGYNATPSVPLFPQIGIATGGGSSLIPSAQRLNSLLPSEQGLYGGALQDEFGVWPNDVFAMTRALAPQVSGLRTPRYTN